LLLREHLQLAAADSSAVVPNRLAAAAAAHATAVFMHMARWNHWSNGDITVLIIALVLTLLLLLLLLLCYSVPL